MRVVLPLCSAGWNTQTTSVTVSEVYTTLDFFSGEVSTPRSYTYTLAPKPDSDEGTFPVAGADYQAMVYVLTGADQSLVNVDFTAVDNTTITRNYQNVPIRRNYQTNIYGNILTEEANFNVEIIPAFDGWYDVYSEGIIADGVLINEAGEYGIYNLAGLIWVADQVNNYVTDFAGKTIKQIADIDIKGNYETSSRLRTAVGKNADYPFAGTFDGNGFRIFNQVQSMNHFGLFRYIAGGAVIKNVTLQVLHVFSYDDGGCLVAYALPGGNALIDNCVVENDEDIAIAITESLPLPDNGWYGRVIGGIIGRLESGNEVRNCTVRNMQISGHTDLGGIAGYSNGTITGCTVENVILKREDNNFLYVADDYSTIHELVGRTGASASESGNTITNVTVLNNPVIRETLVVGADTSIDSDYTVWCSDGEGAYSSENVVGITIKNGATLDANNHVLLFKNSWQEWDTDIQIYSGTLKNAIVKQGICGIFVNGTTGNVYLDNVYIDHSASYWAGQHCKGIHADYGFNHDLIVTNSTINGFSTYCNGAGIVRFTDCTFGANGDGDAFMNIRKKTEFIRCNFKDGFGIDVIGGCQVTLKNCYVGETLITAANIAALLGEDPTNVTIANN